MTRLYLSRASSVLPGLHSSDSQPSSTPTSSSFADRHESEARHGHPWVLEDTLRTLGFSVVGLASHVFLRLFSDVKVYNQQAYSAALVERVVSGRPLVTVSNHNSCLDDPLLLSGVPTLRSSSLTGQVAPWRAFLDNRLIRWQWCASTVCYRNPYHGAIFTLLKAAPVHRGAGLQQPALDWAIDNVRHGQWMHVFPEGSVIKTDYDKLIRCRWGVGKIIAETRHHDPLIVPFVHRGMELVNPLPGNSLRAGKRVRVVFGEPVDLSDVFARYDAAVRAHSESGWGDPFPPSKEWLYAAITQRLTRELEALHRQLEDHQREEQTQQTSTAT